MRRRGWMNGTGVALLVSLSALGARGDSWVGDSLELVVADSDVVVRRTIETLELIPGSGNHKATVAVKETLKGKAGDKIICVVDYFGNGQFPGDWADQKTDLLVCLVKSERYHVKGNKPEPAAEWTVRHKWNGEMGMIPLNGKAVRGVATTDFTLLTKSEDILKLAHKAVKVDADSKVAREANGGVPSLMLNVPFDSALDKGLHSRSSNGLGVPVNELTEGKAREWTRSGNPQERQNAVAVLAHFKSDENIAALKGLLSDPEAQRRVEGADVIAEYPVRSAALAALGAWGVEATATVHEVVGHMVFVPVKGKK